MKRLPCFALALLFAIPVSVAPAQTESPGTANPTTTPLTPHWPSFRGKGASGVLDGFATPTVWDVKKGTNIAWRVKIPGLAHSSPVIAGDRIFLTTAVRESEAPLKIGLFGDIKSVENETENQLQVLCLDRTSGKVIWSQTAWKGIPAVKRHPKGSHAACTPATDGTHVVAFFGSEGLYCYTVDGRLLWSKNFGNLDSGFFRDKSAQWGFCSSPVIHDGRVIVQCDIQMEKAEDGSDVSKSFIASLDVESGKELWRTPRHEVPTWSSPTVHVGKDRTQIIVNGWKHIGGYDFLTGKELWKTSDGGDIPVPTPIVAHDLIYISNAHGRYAPIVAISTHAAGEFSLNPKESEHVVWGTMRRGNYMPTPVVYGDELYLCRDIGALTCYDAKTGEEHYSERLSSGPGYTASGIAADGKLYFPSEVGDVYVVKKGPKFELLATNSLLEPVMASPAMAEGTLYFRTQHHLVAIALAK